MIEPGFGNVVSTRGAVAVFARVDAGERGHDAAALCGAAALRGLGHSLLLERVHSAEAADGLLIQRDGFLAFCAKRILPIKCREIGLETRAVDFNLGR